MIFKDGDCQSDSRGPSANAQAAPRRILDDFGDRFPAKLAFDEGIDAIAPPRGQRCVFIHIAADRTEKDRRIARETVGMPAINARGIESRISGYRFGKRPDLNSAGDDVSLFLFEGVKDAMLRCRVTEQAGRLKIRDEVCPSGAHRQEVIDGCCRVTTVRTGVVVHFQESSAEASGEVNALIADDARGEYERQLDIGTGHHVMLFHTAPPRVSVTPEGVSAPLRHTNFLPDYTRKTLAAQGKTHA